MAEAVSRTNVRSFSSPGKCIDLEAPPLGIRFSQESEIAAEQCAVPLRSKLTKMARQLRQQTAFRVMLRQHIPESHCSGASPESSHDSSGSRTPGLSTACEARSRRQRLVSSLAFVVELICPKSQPDVSLKQGSEATFYKVVAQGTPFVNVFACERSTFKANNLLNAFDDFSSVNEGPFAQIA